MTRIVAGYARSLRLEVPRSGTRPTSDRVREAIFSALDARDALNGAAVLDLFAGSGALGLEAASRGAARVVLVENDARAAAVCKRNALAVRAAAPEASAPRLDVVRTSAAGYLSSAAEPFDVAFLDPPYSLDEDALANVLTVLATRLNPGALVMVERAARSPEPRWPAAIVPDRTSSYGDTLLWWADATSAP